MSSYRVFNHTVNIVAYNKNGINYGACIAWAMQVDYDKILLLMGSQSSTGKNIKKHDIIGVSALNNKQKNIALMLGDNHSDQINKFENIEFNQNKNAITIPDASREVVCEVLDIMHLNEIEEDNLIYAKVISYTENNDDFLNYVSFLEMGSE